MAKLKAIKKSNKNKVKTIDKKVIKKKVKFNLNQNKEKEMSKSLSDSSDVEKNFDENQSEDGSDDGIDDGIDYIVDHKKSLQSLKEKDPEFYEFLRQNDKQLLDFDDKDSDEDIEDLEEDNDFDEELGSIESGDKLTLKMIDDWSLKLNEKSDLDTIKLVVKWFRNVVNQTSDESSTRIVSSDVFNAIVNLCLIDLLPAIHKFLRLQQIGVKETSNETKMIDPTKSRNWKKVMALMKCYLTDVIKLLDVVSDSLVKATILRHILHLIPFYVTFPHLTKRVLKQTIVLWSESDEKNRVLSFLCILRLMRTQEQPMLSFILKVIKSIIFVIMSNKLLLNLFIEIIHFLCEKLQIHN
jgi:nucleolar complex protein 2